MRVAVIIPVRNKWLRVGAALVSLKYQTRVPDYVVTVDDASTDGTGRYIHAWLAGTDVPFKVETVRLDVRRGRAGALNAGVDHLADMGWEPDVVVTLDADTMLGPNYVQEVVRAFRAMPRLGIASGRVTSMAPQTGWQWGRWAEYAWSFHVLRRVANWLGFQWVCSGCCQAVRWEALMQAQGWQNGHLGEDMELTWRVQALGWQARYLPDTVAWTEDPATLRDMSRQVRRWAHAFFQTVRTPMPKRPPARLVLAMGAVGALTGLALWWPLLIDGWWLPWRWAWLLAVPVSVALTCRSWGGGPTRGLVWLVPVALLNVFWFGEAFLTNIVLRRRRTDW